jgi:hypothetical protein
MHARRFLNNFFSCHSKIDILRTIISAEEPQSGRQIAAQAGLSPRSCQLSLDELVRLNALIRREAGKAYYYTVNLDNQIVTDLIIPIIQQEERLTGYVVDLIRSRLNKFKGEMVGIYYLESWPRAWKGKGNGAMLLTIAHDAKKNAALEKTLNELKNELITTFGLPVDHVTITRDQFSEIVKNKPSELNIISGRLQDLVGDVFHDLVRKEKGYPEHLARALDFFPRRGRRRRL